MTLPTAFLQKYAQMAAARAENVFNSLANRAESPIEGIFLTAFYLRAFDEYGGFVFGEPEAGEKAFLFIKLQEPIGDYRADFVVGLCDRPDAARIVVECDGHAFHERTKEQAARDKKRDRFLQSKGYKVFRFTGSELYRDAFSCVGEVIAQAILIDYEASE